MENLSNNQDLLWRVISTFILLTLIFDSGVIIMLRRNQMSVILGGLRVKPSWKLISPSFDRDKIIVKQRDLHKVLSVVFHFIIKFFKCWDHAVWFRFCCWVVIWKVSKLRHMCFSLRVWTNFECSLYFHLVVMIKT